LDYQRQLNRHRRFSMGELTMGKRREEGMVAIWGAITFLFIVGAVAFAADTSGFFKSARADQTTADLACLAGALELPMKDQALDISAENVKVNFPRVASGTPDKSVPDQATITVGGNVVVINTNWDGDPQKMRVHVTSAEPRTFSRIWGSADVPVVQQAICVATPAVAGAGNLPFGAMPGGYSGGLQDCPSNPNPGNCGPLVIPRDDVNGVGPTLINNIWKGADRLLDDWLGPVTGSTMNCGSVNAGDTCHIIQSDTGVSAAHLGQGFINRLSNDPGASQTFTYRGNVMNADTPAQILGSAPTPLTVALGSQPGWWIPSLWGDWPSELGQHYWYDGVVAKCDSPRLARIPIITDNMSWNIGDAPGSWPGKKTVKIVGFFDVIVIDPNGPSDFQGSGNLKTSSAIIMWYGPNAVCSDGRDIGQLNGAAGSGSVDVKLVAS
jgi:hypothetical protein